MPTAVRSRQPQHQLGERTRDLLGWHNLVHGAIEVPNIMEFVVDPGYLGKRGLYPRQATLLKLIFLQTELMTQYDWDVIDEWTTEFERSGNHGLQPDIKERLEWCKRDGRKWFRENVMVVGRRGSKGHLGAISGAYVLWNYLALSDPQDHYGIDPDKRLTSLVFAAKKQQARDEQWRDLYQVIVGANCFARFISRPQAESLTLFAPQDKHRREQHQLRGVEPGMDIASFQILPKESTASAGRGPASFMLFFDEMAHTVNTGANRSAEEVYDAAVPSLDQFHKDGFIWEGSSPWQQMGKFYESYENALLREDNEPVYPYMFMAQLTSWDPYKDWQYAHTLEMWPGGPKFPRLRGAIQTYDEQMQALERANPDKFKVERRAHFGTVLDAYLPVEKVEAMFDPWPTEGRKLEHRESGVLAQQYKAHADPAKSGARFGFALGHAEEDPDNPNIKHVVFDLVHAWDPIDFEDHQIDYLEVEEDLWKFLKGFQPFELTFDQFNSVRTIQGLRRRLRNQEFPKRIQVYEKTATAPLNWERFEVFKTALGMGWVHAPYHEILELEARFLQEKNTSGRWGRVEPPETGPVQTKDVLDCVVEVVYTLIGQQVLEMNEALASTKLGTGAQGGMDPYADQRPQEKDVHDALSGFGSNKGGGISPARGGYRRGREGRGRRGRP